MILESLKNKNNDYICFYSPTHWAVVTWSWNSYQELLVESSPHRLKLELTAGTISAVVVFLYRRGFCSPCPLPPVTHSHVVGIWQKQTRMPWPGLQPPCWGLFGWRVALLCSVKNGHSPWIFCHSKLLQRYFLKVHLMKTPWVLHDFKCPSNTLNLFCCFPSNMFSIFSPLIWKWCDWNSPNPFFLYAGHHSALHLPVCNGGRHTASFGLGVGSLVKMRHQNISKSVYIQG